MPMAHLMTTANKYLFVGQRDASYVNEIKTNAALLFYSSSARATAVIGHTCTMQCTKKIFGKQARLITYHVWIDNLIYSSPRESFHKFVKCSVNNDCQNECDKSSQSENQGYC